MASSPSSKEKLRLSRRWLPTSKAALKRGSSSAFRPVIIGKNGLVEEVAW